MSFFLNNVDANNQFIKTTKEKYFVDKTELIDKLNELVGSARQFVCITRPRRFGKSINASMLASYYANNLDTKDVFDKLNISKCPSYKEHLNKHNVIYILFNTGNENFKTYAEYKHFFRNGLIKDMQDICPEINELDPISKICKDAYQKSGQRFIFIIDEWDYIFNRNMYSTEDRMNLLDFLQDLLKDQPYVELAYMTGILPIAKYFSGSFCNMFDEYTMVSDDLYGDYFGFTQPEVEMLCAKQDKISMQELEEWYNGYYTEDDQKIYNPRSVVYALNRGKCRNYWTNTGSMNEIVDCIQNDIDDVRNDIVDMLDGKELHAILSDFRTERIQLDTKEQIFSAMVVLGFLSYHNGILKIPNKELKIKFVDSLENKIFGDFARIVQNSNRLLSATLNKDTTTMEKLLKEAHSLYTSIFTYNNENSIACVLQKAYLSATKKYDIYRELNAGEGLADFVFIPLNKNETAFILELKVNSTPEEALKQIRNKDYTQALRNCRGKKLAVGISYAKKNTSDDDNRYHFVKIEEIE